MPPTSIITVHHYLHGTPLRVKVLQNGNRQRLWLNVDQPHNQPLADWEFSETREQIEQKLAQEEVMAS